MRNPPRATAGDADVGPIRATAPVTFSIRNRRTVSYGSKLLEFELVTPLGVLECDLFAPAGRSAFIAARSVRCKYSGAWKRTIEFDRTFAARILEALGSRTPEAKHERAQRFTPAPSETLLTSEARFERAFGELDENGVS